MPAASNASKRAQFALGALDLRPVAHDDRDVARLEAEAADRFLAERPALRVLLGADIATAELGGDFVHRHVLVHHLDASLGGFLGQRHDRRVAGVAHHGDAVGLGGNRFAQLLDHLLGAPAREHVVDLGAGILGGLDRAIVDDRGEGIAFRTAHKEADLDVAAPLVAQRFGLRGAGRGRDRDGRQRGSRQEPSE